MSKAKKINFMIGLIFLGIRPHYAPHWVFAGIVVALIYALFTDSKDHRIF